MTLLQNLPTNKWGDEDIGELTAEAYKLKYMYAGAPQHYKTKTWYYTGWEVRRYVNTEVADRVEMSLISYMLRFCVFDWYGWITIVRSLLIVLFKVFIFDGL